MEDPRAKNLVFSDQSIAEFVKGYSTTLADAFTDDVASQIERAVDAILKCASDGGTVYFAGNGGSAAICDHMVCDYVKGTYHPDHPAINAISMAANGALYSAIANDFGFEEVFTFQVKTRMTERDLLLCISSSGNSPNIVRAVEDANARGIETIGLSGFSGGKLKDVSNIPIYLAVNNYGVVEDGHQSVLHMIAQIIANGRDGRSVCQAG